MREKLGPWLPAIFCAVLAVITTVGNLWTYAVTGDNGSVTMVYIVFMPMCFFFVGAYLTQLRNENREMRTRLDALDSAMRHA
jgi:hypothetical protein